MTVECDILSHSATPFCYWFAAIIIYQGGGVALSYIHPDLTAVELSNRTHFIILIVIVLLIFRPQEITIKIKSKIKRANVAKHLLDSMAVHPDPLPQGEGTASDASSCSTPVRLMRRMDSPTTGGRFSLSLGERVGVRGTGCRRSHAT